MKFNIGDAVPDTYLGARVGDVYAAKGGRGGITRFWLVMAITQHGGCHVLGLDSDGNVVSTQSYGNGVMEERSKLGFCPDIADFKANIEWAKP